jgi:hypothetical protein
VTAAGAEAGNDLVAVGAGSAASGQAVEATALSAPASVNAWTSMTRVIVAVLLAVLTGIGAWLLLQRGVVTDVFPPFIAEDTATDITRYSGPWLTAATGAALLSALMVLWAVVELVRRPHAAAGNR